MRYSKTIFFSKIQVDLKHMNQEPGNNVVAIGIDLSEFYLRYTVVHKIIWKRKTSIITR